MVFRLSQSYLKLVNAYKKRLMPQNGQVAVSKCSLLWKKMRKSFGKSELKLKFIRLKTRSYDSRPPLKVVH